MLKHRGCGKHAFFKHELEVLWCNLVRVILWWLEVDREVACNFVEEALFELLDDCFVRRPIELTVLA